MRGFDCATRLGGAVAATALLLAPAAGGSDQHGPQLRPAGAGPVTIRVPEHAPTIATALAVARDGDRVLMAAGVYRESVRISTPRVTLRGVDRARVVIDGEGVRGNGVQVTADGVAVENLTVRAHRQAGVTGAGVRLHAVTQTGNDLSVPPLSEASR